LVSTAGRRGSEWHGTDAGFALSRFLEYAGSMCDSPPSSVHSSPALAPSVFTDLNMSTETPWSESPFTDPTLTSHSISILTKGDAPRLPTPGTRKQPTNPPQIVTVDKNFNMVEELDGFRPVRAAVGSAPIETTSKRQIVEPRDPVKDEADRWRSFPSQDQPGEVWCTFSYASFCIMRLTLLRRTIDPDG
jgi:hypothetical protein